MTVIEIIGNQQVRIELLERQVQQLTAANNAFAEADRKQSLEIASLRGAINNFLSVSQAAELFEAAEEAAQKSLNPEPQKDENFAQDNNLPSIHIGDTIESGTGPTA